MPAFDFDATIANFSEKVIDASHRVLVLVDFWAEWCGPCRVLGPILEKLCAEYSGRFLLARVNSDVEQELAASFGIRGIPNVKAFVDGKVVNEFSGALPESQVRAFIERILPSPAEPLRAAAREARGKGELDAARALLTQARQLDPASEDVGLDLIELDIDAGNFEEARAVLTSLAYKVRDEDRRQKLLAQLNLAAAGGGDEDALRQRIADDPADLDARLQLANALAQAANYRGALEQLIEIVQRDKSWQEEAGRKRMLDLFTLIGEDPQQADLVREFRVKLARTLN